MTIIVDVDCVLNNLTQAALDAYNKANNTNFLIDNVTSYNFYDCLPKEAADSIRSMFQDKDFWDSLKPIQYAQDGLQNLIKRGHKVYLATATDPVNFAWKVQWLHKYYPFLNLDNVIRIMDKSLLRCDILIDDCMDNLTEIVCDRICLDYPWNRSSSKDYAYSINRAYDWHDVIDIIKKLEKENETWK